MSERKHDGGVVDPNIDYERKDVSIRPLMIFSIGLVVFLFFVLALFFAGFFWLSGRLPGTRADGGVSATAANPDLGQEMLAQRAALEKLENSELTAYGWIDRARGVVRIPVDRAMALAVERGFPSRAERGTDAR